MWKAGIEKSHFRLAWTTLKDSVRKKKEEKNVYLDWGEIKISWNEVEKMGHRDLTFFNFPYFSQLLCVGQENKGAFGYSRRLYWKENLGEILRDSRLSLSSLVSSTIMFSISLVFELFYYNVMIYSLPWLHTCCTTDSFLQLSCLSLHAILNKWMGKQMDGFMIWGMYEGMM